jgi:prepilin-type N-terminal cleavage/methylation domain-containing protein/prepilin-type processing-associated H-X9-DG protein
MATRHEARARCAFTLIELLVVIAIVALLIGLLLPSLKSARDSAWSAVCLTRMRSLGQATAFYCDDNADVIHRSKHSVGFSGVAPWSVQLYPYLTGRDFEGNSDLWQDPSWWNATNEFYRCPHDRRVSPIDQPGLPFDVAAISYGLNVYYELRMEEIDPSGRAGDSREPYRKRASIARPSGTVLFAEMKDTMSADHVMAHYWRTRGVTPGYEVAADRHGSGAGYVFLDGHAATASLGDVYDASRGRDAWDPGSR